MTLLHDISEWELYLLWPRSDPRKKPLLPFLSHVRHLFLYLQFPIPDSKNVGFFHQPKSPAVDVGGSSQNQTTTHIPGLPFPMPVSPSVKSIPPTILVQFHMRFPKR